MEYAQIKYKKPLIIGEAGINHQGSMDIAYDMIKTASVYCKCEYIKFQKRDVSIYKNDSQYLKPHPDPDNSFGETYYEHKKNLEFELDQHKQLQKWCNENNIKYACSVWDIQSAKDIISLAPDYIKIPSAANQKFGLIAYICKNFDKEIHISLGMTTEEEMYNILESIKTYNRLQDLVLYGCTSSYPCRPENICILELEKLYNLCYLDGLFKDTGFSGHHLGFSIDMAAIMLGIKYIERHFTLDRSQKGSDHASSLEPDQLRRLVRDRDNLFKTFGYKPKDTILDCEMSSRKKMKVQG